MNCPHCQKELPENYSSTKCPACGRELPPTPATGAWSDEQSAPRLNPVPVNWLFFFLILFAPALVALAGSLLKLNDVAFASPIVGGLLAGINCGIMLARRIGRTESARAGLGFIFFVATGFLSFALGFVGCTAGGYQLDMR